MVRPFGSGFNSPAGSPQTRSKQQQTIKNMTTQDNTAAQQVQAIQQSGKRTLREWLDSDEVKAALNGVASKIVTGERLANVAIQCLQKTPDLQICAPSTLISALKTLGMMGCEPDGIHGYLVPHKAKDGSVTATPIPSARGLMRMARANGVKNLNIGIVREGDSFSWKIKNNKFSMEHEEAWPNTGAALGYYCIWNDQDNAAHGVRMTMEEVEDIRKRSRAGSNGPWVTDFDQMALKTVIKRAAKQWDMPAEVQLAMREADSMEFAEREMRNVTPQKNGRLALTIEKPEPQENQEPGDMLMEEIGE